MPAPQNNMARVLCAFFAFVLALCLIAGLQAMQPPPAISQETPAYVTVADLEKTIDILIGMLNECRSGGGRGE